MMRSRLGPCTLLVLTACLPAETRTKPGMLVIEAAAARPVNEAVQTDDGWSLTVAHVYASVGRVELLGEDCEAYSEAGYTRLLDLSSTEPQRVSLLYGLGVCSPAFALSGPRWNTRLGYGVPASIEREFRTPGDDGEGAGGISLYVSGKATRDAHAVHFAWPFRAVIAFNDCRLPDSEGTLTLASGAQHVLLVELDALQLFRSDEGELLFAAFAAADAQSPAPDGSITLEELAGGGEPSLLTDLYRKRLLRTAALAGSSCAGQVETCDSECDD